MKLNSKIFVAGHNGLVGSAIVKELLEKGYTNIITKNKFELNLLNYDEVELFLKKNQPKYVFMAAAKVGGIVANNKYRADFIYENLTIQNNVIHLSYLNNVKKLLFLGSTCIYPKEAPQPIKEDYLLTNVLEYTNEPYAIAKIAGIKMCESYNIQYNTNFISVMPTNLFGFNDNFNLENSHVLPALIRKIHLGKALEENNWDLINKDLNNLPISQISGTNTKAEIIEVLHKFGISYNNITHKVQVEIWGSGKPKREFLWSQDMANACVFVMENINFKDLISNTNEVRNTHLNIGTGEDIEIKELALLIQSIIKFKGDFVFNSSKPDGTMRKMIDVSKINKLGWKHKMELQNGIKEVFLWYLNKFND